MVANLTNGGTVRQLIHLAYSGVLEPLVNLLTIPDAKFVVIILDIIFFLLQVSCSGQVGFSVAVSKLKTFHFILKTQVGLSFSTTPLSPPSVHTFYG